MCASSTVVARVAECSDVHPCATPIPVLLVSRVLPACGGSDLVLDATQSQVIGPRPGEYFWSVGAQSDNADRLNDFLSTQTSEIVEVPSALLDGFSFFSFRVSIENFVKRVGESELRSVTRQSEPAPVVRIDSAETVSMDSLSTLRLQARATLTCNVTTAVVWSWSAVKVGAPSVRLALGDTASKSTLLLSGRLLLPVGSAYNVSVLGCAGVGANRKCDLSWVVVTLSDLPLVARLRGGDRSIGALDELSLDASLSSDPDLTSPLGASAFSWGCVSSIADACPASVASASGSVFKLPAEALVAGTYTFTVTVTSGSDVDTASAVVTVRPGRLPIVAVERPADSTALTTKQNAHEKLRLLGDARVAGLPDLPYCAVASAVSSGECIALEWQYDPPTSGPLDTPALTGGVGNSKANLALEPNVLSTTVDAYTFKLQATYVAEGEARVAESALSVTMNKPPRFGTFSVSPETGFELNTTFVLSASGWFDLDTPMAYSFSYTTVESNRTTTISAFSALTRAEVILPAGQHRMSVRVRDRLGAVATQSKKLIVSKLPEISATVIESVVGEANAKLDGGDFEGALQNTDALLSAVNQRETEGGSALTQEEATTAKENIFFTVVAPATNSLTPTSDSLSMAFSAVDSVTEVTDQISEDTLSGATGLVLSLVNTSNNIDDSLAEGTDVIVVATISSLLFANAKASAAQAAADTAAGAANASEANVTVANVTRSNVVSTRFASMRSSVSGLGRAMLKGALPGEAPAVALGTNVQLSMQLVDDSVLGSSNFSSPLADAAFFLPARGVEFGGNQSSTQVQYATFKVNTYQADSDATVETGLSSITLADGTGEARRVSLTDCSTPIVIQVPISRQVPSYNCSALATSLALSNSPANSSSAGSHFNVTDGANATDTDANTTRLSELCSVCDEANGSDNCNGNGECVAGQCYCDLGYSGANCSIVASCQFWDVTLGEWSSEGVTTSFLESEGLMLCQTCHLTDFAGLSIPFSKEEILKELTAIKLTLPCADGFTGEFDWDENPALFGLIFGLTALNLVCLPLGYWRYRYRCKQAGIEVAGNYRKAVVVPLNEDSTNPRKPLKKQVTRKSESLSLRFLPSKSDAVNESYESADAPADSFVHTSVQIQSIIKIQAVARGRIARKRLQAGMALAMERAQQQQRRGSVKNNKETVADAVEEAVAEKRFSILTGSGLRQVVAETSANMVVESRDRHSLLSVAAPQDIDVEDKYHLRDHQVVQIFFNALIVELCVTALWNDTSTNTVCDPVPANSTESNSADSNSTDTGDKQCSSSGNIKILTVIISGMFLALCLLATALVSRFIFRFGNMPSKRRWLFRLRTALAWAGNLTIWACGCWVAIAYGRCMGRKSTELLLIGWATGCGISWCIMEPAWIFLIIFAPCLCNNKIMNTINDRLNDLGLDLSLLA